MVKDYVKWLWCRFLIFLDLFVCLVNSWTMFTCRIHYLFSCMFFLVCFVFNFCDSNLIILVLLVITWTKLCAGITILSIVYLMCVGWDLTLAGWVFLVWLSSWCHSELTMMQCRYCFVFSSHSSVVCVLCYGLRLNLRVLKKNYLVCL